MKAGPFDRQRFDACTPVDESLEQGLDPADGQFKAPTVDAGHRVSGKRRALATGSLSMSRQSSSGSMIEQRDVL